MKIAKMSLLLIIIVAILLLLFFLYSVVNKENNINSTVNPKINVKKENNNLIGCTRKSRLDNLPQYDRALSLIQQRLIVNLKRFKYNNRAIFTYFPPELTNCIKVIEETPDKSNNFEGYFKFNGNDIKHDYYPIIVNSKYVESDDALIALLLTHEMTHVQQYIDSVNKIKTFSCIDGEVNAFLAEERFYISGLNDEENRSVLTRINEALDNKETGFSLEYPNPFDSQLLMLNTIQNLFSSPLSKCEKPEFPGYISEAYWEELGHHTECIDAEVPVLLKNIIENDDYYKKQCGL